MSRIALLHTGSVVIPTFAELTRRYWPATEVLNLLDDRIVADLADPIRCQSVPARLVALTTAARAAGAAAVVFTCSSISGHAAAVAAEVGLPVLRIDEAMADHAAAIGGRIAVIATLPTTLEPTCALLAERLRKADRSAQVTRVLVAEAFAAAVSGDRARHDQLVSRAIADAAGAADVVVLAQASMASAAGDTDGTPVLTSPTLGVIHIRDTLGLH